MEPSYVYRATSKRIVDGDTFVAVVDLGFGASIELKVRLHGVNSPERNTVAGKDATLFLERTLTGRDLLLKSYKDARSFERWVCDVYYDNHAEWASVAQAIIDLGYGEPYMV
jgi:micrococcal nuclease